MSSEPFAMNSKGKYSYALHSSYQAKGADSVINIIKQEIKQNINITQLLSSSTLFKITDLGCSIGPNTFTVIQNIVEAIEAKYRSEAKTLEFQVFFNDQVTNDFNALFKSLPPQRRYYASAVPGSFYGRLFPKASLHFVYSAYALHWLSMVPKEVVQRNSPAWNKGRILYGSKEVEAAYAAQYMKDMELFLAVRAEELVPGGVVAFAIVGIPDGLDPSKFHFNAIFTLLGSALMDMANLGIVDEDKVDGFNFPMFYPSSKELKESIDRNGCFTIQRIEELVPRAPFSARDIQKIVFSLRAGVEELLTKHFGSEVIDELFDRFTKKIMESSIFQDGSYVPYVNRFVFLRRKSEG